MIVALLKYFGAKLKKTYHIPFRLPLCFTHIYVAVFTEMLPKLRLRDYLFKKQNKTLNMLPRKQGTLCL